MRSSLQKSSLRKLLGLGFSMLNSGDQTKTSWVSIVIIILIMWFLLAITQKNYNQIPSEEDCPNCYEALKQIEAN